MNEVDTSLSALRRDAGPDLPVAREVASLVRSIGGRAWLVGGCVRDALLGRPCHDFDLEVYGVPADRLEPALAARWPLDKVGAAFGISRIGASAVESMARQPEASGSINSAMIVSAALIEGATFFALIICLLGILG